MTQIQLAASAEDRKSCWRRNYKKTINYRSQGKFLVPEILDAWMHNLCNFPEFSFGAHVQPGQSWPQFLIVIM